MPGRKPKVVEVGSYVVTVEGGTVTVAKKGSTKALLTKRDMTSVDITTVMHRLHEPAPVPSQFLAEWLKYPDHKFVDRLTVCGYSITFTDTLVKFQRSGSNGLPHTKTYDSMHAVRIIYGRLRNDPDGAYLSSLLRRIEVEQVKAGFALVKPPAEKPAKARKPAKAEPESETAPAASEPEVLSPHN